VPAKIASTMMETMSKSLMITIHLLYYVEKSTK
jgi:hypothetical protein